MSKELSSLEAFQLFCKELKIENSEFAKTIENALKTNKKKLDVIGEILVDISKGNYADLNTAIDEIREELEK